MTDKKSVEIFKYEGFESEEEARKWYEEFKKEISELDHKLNGIWGIRFPVFRRFPFLGTFDYELGLPILILKEEEKDKNE